MPHARAHRIIVTRPAAKGPGRNRPAPCLVRFLDPLTGEPIRTLPLLLEGEREIVNGFELRGDERIEIISPCGGVHVTIDPRSAVYVLARRAATALVEPALRRKTRGTLPPKAPAASPPWPAPQVSLVIATRDRAELLAAAVRTLFHEADYPALDLVIVDNGSVESSTAALLASYRDDPRITVLRRDAPFNFAWLSNEGAKVAKGEFLAFLNNDVEALSNDWMSRLVHVALREAAGVVGAKLVYPDFTLQHAGIVLGLGGLAGHVGRGLSADAPGPGGFLTRTREVSAVTAACMLTPRLAFETLGGFDERFVVEFNDVDYCLRMRSMGRKVICAAEPILVHKESATRGRGLRPSAQVMADQTLFMTTWGTALVDDPFCPPTLSRRSEAIERD